MFIQFITEQNVLIPERNGVVPERNGLIPEQKALISAQNSLVPEGSAVIPEENGVIRTKKNVYDGPCHSDTEDDMRRLSLGETLTGSGLMLAGLKEKTAQIDEAVASLKDKLSEARKVIKLELPQTGWKEFGITDVR